MDFGARMYDSRVGRWFARDPLEKQYPDLSTYSYVANNPLIYVDPDGKKIIIYYLDKYGKEQAFEYKPCIVPPDNEFVRNAVNSLDKMVEAEAFKNIEIEDITKKLIDYLI